MMSAMTPEGYWTRTAFGTLDREQMRLKVRMAAFVTEHAGTVAEHAKISGIARGFWYRTAQRDAFVSPALVRDLTAYLDKVEAAAAAKHWPPSPETRPEEEVKETKLPGTIEERVERIEKVCAGLLLLLQPGGTIDNRLRGLEGGDASLRGIRLNLSNLHRRLHFLENGLGIKSPIDLAQEARHKDNGAHKDAPQTPSVEGQ